MTPAERLDALARGRDPQFVAKMASGYAVMGDSQFLTGYCVLLAEPLMGQLNDLEGETRTQFLNDMATLGDAILQATGAERINYAILGNQDPFLHAHVFPRFKQEDPKYRSLPPLLIPAEVREHPDHRWNAAKHSNLMRMIEERIDSAELELGNVLD